MVRGPLHLFPDPWFVGDSNYDYPWFSVIPFNIFSRSSGWTKILLPPRPSHCHASFTSGVRGSTSVRRIFFSSSTFPFSNVITLTSGGLASAPWAVDVQREMDSANDLTDPQQQRCSDHRSGKMAFPRHYASHAGRM